MIPLALDEIRSLARGRLEAVPGADVVTGIQIDSRRVAVGDLFVAVRSGVDYMPEAEAKRYVELVSPVAATLMANNPKSKEDYEALLAAAKKYRK